MRSPFRGWQARVIAMPDDITSLVTRMYAALVEGNRAELDVLLAGDFVGEFATGMPAGGGRHEGAGTARRNGWGAIGRAFAAAADPHELVPCTDGRLLVLGSYEGTARATNQSFEAAFTHVWTARAGKLVHLRQLTDTAAWQAATRDGT